MPSLMFGATFYWKGIIFINGIYELIKGKNDERRSHGKTNSGNDRSGHHGLGDVGQSGPRRIPRRRLRRARTQARRSRPFGRRGRPHLPRRRTAHRDHDHVAALGGRADAGRRPSSPARAGPGRSSSKPARCRFAVKEAARTLLARRGVALLDCPLSGTGAQARVKDLIVYASGDRSACRKAAAGARRLHARQLFRRRIRQRLEDEIRRQPARRNSQRRRGGGDGARHESRGWIPRSF